jgi:hypothetical protein
MCNLGGIWNFERLKLHVGEIDFPGAGDLLIEAAVAQVAVPALDRTIMDAFEPSDRTPSGVAAHGPNRLDTLIAGPLASGLALHRTPHGSRVITASLDRAIDKTRLPGAAPIPVRRPR